MPAPTRTETLAARIERERAAHSEDDVLGRSVELKNRFAHIWSYPGLKRLHAEFGAWTHDLQGQAVLDLGCGRGERALDLLGADADVTGVDISAAYIEEASAAAEGAGFPASQYRFLVGDAHALPFVNGSFDMVVGNGILHHLDLPIALGEVRRLLAPGGRALFLEPLLDNPLLKAFRRLTPRARTDDERPLSREDLQRIARSGDWDVQSSYCGLIGAPAAVVTSLLIPSRPNNAALRLADRIEQRLAGFPALAPFHQYVLLNLVRREGS
jgi:SAM-dependent methyltransferase